MQRLFELEILPSVRLFIKSERWLVVGFYPDEDINTIVTPTAPAAIHTGPITRARARQLNYQVLSFLGNDSNVHENMMLPNFDTFVFLTNEGNSLDKKDEPWSKFKHGDDACARVSRTELQVMISGL